MKDIIIIAEAGVNHNGSLKKAKKLIDVAASSGADIIKFQSFEADKLVIKNSKKANYQIDQKNRKETQYDMLKKLTLTENIINQLTKYSKKKNIEFLSSAFDIENLKKLLKKKIKRIKIPSGEINNFQFLEFISKQKMPIILSTGMSTLLEVKKALRVLQKNGLTNDKITILHCTSEYPANMNSINLNAMKTLKKFKTKIGYSDHSLGSRVAIAAAALGATIIEKHITLNNKMSGPDHLASLNPVDFKKFVKDVRSVKTFMGSNIKRPTLEEKKTLKLVRKSIVAIDNINKGQKFDKFNIGIKRPGTGKPPKYLNSILKKRAHKNYKKDDLI